MAPVLRQIYDQMAEPRWVLAMGVCASSGGMFNNYAVVQGVDHVVPVDMYLPGCPPRPEMLIDAILKLHQKIQHGRSAPARRRARAQGEKLELLPVLVKYGSLERGPTSSPASPDGGRAARGAADGRDQCPARRRAGRPSTPPGADGHGRPARACSASRGSGDTSGFGGLRLPAYAPAPAERPTAAGSTRSSTSRGARSTRAASRSTTRSTQVVVDRGEMTCTSRREHLPSWPRPCATTRRCASSSAPGCPASTTASAAAQLHSVVHLLSMTYRRRLRLEVAWSGRGPARARRSFDLPDGGLARARDLGHVRHRLRRPPGLTRILMPDDWNGHPQRKDYPLGGIPVEYKGAEIPPPDQRRAYT